MATKLYLTNTACTGLSITGFTMKSLSANPGSGLVSESVASFAGTGEINAGTTPTLFAAQINTGFTLANNPSFNFWGSESNAMANATAGAQVHRANDGSSSTNATPVQTTAWQATTEWGTSSAVRTATSVSFTPTVSFIAPNWVIIEAMHGSLGTAASGFTLNFNHSGASAGADGDSFVTFVENFTIVENGGGGGGAVPFPYIGGGYYG